MANIKKCCGICQRLVKDGQRAIMCAVCARWTHLNCTALTDIDFRNLTTSSSKNPWFCTYCLENIFPFNAIVEDFEFMHCLFNYSCNNKMNSDCIKNSEQLELTKKFKCCNNDLDPDKHFYNAIGVSNLYYLEEDFNKLFDCQTTDVNFSVLHVNARSLSKNFEQLYVYLTNLDHRFSIIAITETWTTVNNEMIYKIPGYNHVVKSRDGRGGGVALYVIDSLKFNVRADLNAIANPSFECIFVEITSSEFGTKVIGSIYHPPNSCINQFKIGFETILNSIKHGQTEFILAGDYNFDLLKYECHPDTTHFVNSMYSHSLIPLIVRPTRFGPDSCTLIDNILTNKPNDASISGLLISDISDHLPVFYITKTKYKNPSKQFKTITSRSITDTTIEQLKTQLGSADWSDLPLDNASSAYDYFVDKFMNILNTVMPLKSRKVRCYSNLHKPWITPAIQKSIKRKNYLYRSSLKSKSPYSENKYKTYKNKLTSIIRIAEKDYYYNKFDMAKGNIGKTWTIIKDLINLKNDRYQAVPELKVLSSVINNEQAISSAFNEYFVNIGPSLANKIPNVEGHVTDYIGGNFQHSMIVNSTDATEIINITMQLKNSDSKGHDGISSKLTKAIIPEIANILAIIFDKSLQDGIFPDNLKIAKVVPIHKSEDKNIVSNYRPISVLPVFSKILEKLMYNRLLKYLNSKNILNKNQYGFREKHSTYMALLQLIDDISKEMDNRNHTIGIFIDLSKAFDTIDHKLLLKKMEFYGIRGIALQWFTSYLTNRKQFVSVNNVDSNLLPITCGVPQGSILGPLLFILYINDIINSSNLANFIMFADDTNIFFKHPNWDILLNMVNEELYEISRWFKLNKLSLNIKKTNYIIFKNKNASCSISPDIRIDNIKIQQVFQTKFLGVIINSNLTWTDHINTVSNKICKSMGIIYKIRQNVHANTLLLLYHTLIHPYLQYCNIIWGADSSIAMQQLYRKQKKAVRIITFSKWNAHTAQIFQRLNLLPIPDIYKMQVSCFVYRALNGLLPDRFRDLFSLNRETHEHYTRQSSKLHVFQSRLKIRQNSIRIFGPKLWNSLPDKITSSPSFYIFKLRCKLWLNDGIKNNGSVDTDYNF